MQVSSLTVKTLGVALATLRASSLVVKAVGRVPSTIHAQVSDVAVKALGLGAPQARTGDVVVKVIGVAGADFRWEDAIMAFDDAAVFPDQLAEGAQVWPRFATEVASAGSGQVQRNSLWDEPLLEFDLSTAIRSAQELSAVIAFFRARRGKARGFRIRDFSDYSSAGWDDQQPKAVSPLDQSLGLGDGSSTVFPLRKLYVDLARPHWRTITKPIAGTVRVAVDGLEVSGWTVDAATGLVTFTAPPAPAAVVTAGFEFHVPVAFSTDKLPTSWQPGGLAAGDSITLIELRDGGL